MHVTNGACFITWIQCLVFYVCCSFIYYAFFGLPLNYIFMMENCQTHALHIIYFYTFIWILVVYLEIHFSMWNAFIYIIYVLPYFPLLTLFITCNHPIYVFYRVTTNLCFFNVPLPSNIGNEQRNA